MRICHVTSVHDLRIDARIVPKMALSAAKAGHDVVVVAPDQNGMSKDTWKDIQVQTVGMPENRFRRLQNVGKVIQVAESQKADIYHLHDPELLPFARRLRDAGGGRVVMDYHELVWADLLDKEYLPKAMRRLGSWLWPRLERQWLKGVDGIILAEDCYHTSYAHYKMPTEVIHNFPLVPDNLPKPTRVPSRGELLKMVYVGAIMPTRAILEMAQAARIVTERWNGGAHLHIYGPLDDDRYTKQLKGVADPEVVTLHGILSQEKVIETVRRMHVSFALFHKRPSSYGSFQTKILESMLVGIPIVTTNRPVVRKHLLPPIGGVLVDSLKPDLLASAVLEIACNPEFYEHALKAAQRVLRDYTWQRENERLLAFYGKLSCREGAC